MSLRALAIALITRAAGTAGIPEDSVFPELENEADEEAFLPEERLEMAFLEETFKYQGWRVGRLLADDSATFRTRWAKYQATLPVRVLIRGTDQNRLDALCRGFLLALPGKARDSYGNTVRVKAGKAVRKGYTFASIRIEEKPTQAIHVNFSGIVHEDVDTGAITRITLHPDYEVKQ